MKIGETKDAIVHSIEFWNHTNIELKKGNTYSISVDPKDQKWTDGKWIKEVCNAEGFSHRILDIFSFLKRYKSAKWFCLIGCIDKSPEDFFKIGIIKENYTPTKTGILNCFANDAKGHYKNNSGSISIKVKRIK